MAAEARLPGLAEWIRVVDYRLGQISRLDNVEHYPESDMTAAEALSYGFDHVAVATGSQWRRDGVARWHTRAGAMAIGGLPVYTPDDIMAGARPPAGTRVAVYDDDHYYMEGVLAELLQGEGFEVALATPEPLVSAWTVNTMEQHRIQARLMEAGVELHTSSAVSAVLDDGLLTECAFTGRGGSDRRRRGAAGNRPPAQRRARPGSAGPTRRVGRSGFAHCPGRGRRPGSRHDRGRGVGRTPLRGRNWKPPPTTQTPPLPPRDRRSGPLSQGLVRGRRPIRS